MSEVSCLRAWSAGLWIACIFVLPSLTYAAERDRASLSIENDMWGRPRSDRNYTMGAAYSETRTGRPDGRLVPNWLLSGLAAINRITGIEPDGPTPKSQTAWILATSAFTPEDVTIAEGIYTDRPYASLIYLGSQYRTMRSSHSLETTLELGVLGTNLAKVAQTEIHRMCCRDRPPRGWHNQIGDGGALTFRYSARWISGLVERRSLGNLGRYSVHGYVGGDLGYYTRAALGITFFFGATEADLSTISFSGVKNSAWAYGIGPPSQTREPRGSNGKGISAWLDYELSAFAYNQLLQGAWSGRNNVTFDYDQLEPLVHKLSAGLELTFLARMLGLSSDSDLRIHLIQSWRSKDLNAPFGRSHNWGGVILSWDL